MGCASRPKQSRDRPLRRSRAKAGEGAVCVYTAIGEDSSGNFSTNSVTANLPATSMYAYDLNGNLTNDGYRSFAYDDENELIAVWVTNAWSNSFAYDGKMRRRIERDYTYLPSSNSCLLTNKVHFIYDGDSVVEERNANNTPTISYTRGNALLLARTTYGQELPGAPTTAFYHADGNGNITALIYPNQQLAAKYLYDPFGGTLAMNGPLMTLNKYRFSSKEWNQNLSLYYYGRRFYNPAWQKWLNEDPDIKEGQSNPYIFAENEPIAQTDPLGLRVLPLDVAIWYTMLNRPAGIHDDITFCVMLALLWKESSFDTTEESTSSTAKGIAQILDGTADDIQDRIAPNWGGSDPFGDLLPGQRLRDHRFDPQISIFAAYLYLEDRYDATGSLQGALRAYGPGGDATLKAAQCVCNCGGIQYVSPYLYITQQTVWNCLYTIHN